MFLSTTCRHVHIITTGTLYPMIRMLLKTDYKWVRHDPYNVWWMRNLFQSFGLTFTFWESEAINRRRTDNTMAKAKRINNDVQRSTQKVKDWATLTQLKHRSELRGSCSTNGTEHPFSMDVCSSSGPDSRHTMFHLNLSSAFFDTSCW
jgi:hypothetical protein